MITALILLCCWRLGLRIILRRFRGQGYNTRTVAIAGASESGTQVANLINASPWMGLNLVGCFDDRQQSSERLNWEGPLEGNFSNLLDRARTRDIDVVYITLPMKASERIDALLTKLSDTTTSVYVIPEPFWLNLMHSRLINLGPLPTISVFETPFYGLNGWFKRLQDIVLASIILMMISVPMLLIAIGVKLSSPGPIFFKQKRYGLDGQEIDVWKFRSMRVCENGAKVTQAKRNDHRITAFGSFLRRTSLDELPQFINVLQGDMSIVGPRPHAVAHNEQYRALIRGYMLRHKVKPGITGWAQINGWRGETDTIDKMEKRVQHDLWYIKNWSFWLDLKIIFLTLFKGFIGKNAY
jgi:putative colanic acid biosynthesis UDP-glucose lipid carrier transferase